MSSVEEKLEKLSYQVRLLGESLDFSSNPIAALVIQLDWGVDQLRIANDIFEEYDSRLHAGDGLDKTNFEIEFKDRLGIGYQSLKLVVLAFFENRQWTSVCIAYARQAPCVEFDEILDAAREKIDVEALRAMLNRQYPSLRFSRDSKQEGVALELLSRPSVLPQATPSDIMKLLDNTKEPRAIFAESYPPKSALDQVIRAIAITHPETLDETFPSRNRDVDSLLQTLASKYLAASSKAYVVVEGPGNLLDAVAEKVNNFRRKTSLFFAGAIQSVSTMSGGVGPGPHKTDSIVIHIREGVPKPDAMKIIDVVLDQVAEEEGLQAVRRQATIVKED